MHIARHKKERYSFFSCKHHGSLIRYNVRFVRNADIVCQCPINVADEDTSKESTRGRIAGEKRRGAYAESENFFWSDFVLKKLSLSLSLSHLFSSSIRFPSRSSSWCSPGHPLIHILPRQRDARSFDLIIFNAIRPGFGNWREPAISY